MRGEDQWVPGWVRQRHTVEHTLQWLQSFLAETAAKYSTAAAAALAQSRLRAKDDEAPAAKPVSSPEGRGEEAQDDAAGGGNDAGASLARFGSDSGAALAAPAVAAGEPGVQRRISSGLPRLDSANASVSISASGADAGLASPDLVRRTSITSSLPPGPAAASGGATGTSDATAPAAMGPSPAKRTVLRAALPAAPVAGDETPPRTDDVSMPYCVPSVALELDYKVRHPDHVCHMCDVIPQAGDAPYDPDVSFDGDAPYDPEAQLDAGEVAEAGGDDLPVYEPYDPSAAPASMQPPGSKTGGAKGYRCALNIGSKVMANISCTRVYVCRTVPITARPFQPLLRVCCCVRCSGSGPSVASLRAAPAAGASVGGFGGSLPERQTSLPSPNRSPVAAVSDLAPVIQRQLPGDGAPIEMPLDNVGDMVRQA